MADSQKKRLDVFTVQEPTREGDKGFWYRIGSAWVNQDGSINVLLAANPINGKLNIREPLPPREDDQRPPQQQQRQQRAPNEGRGGGQQGCW
jgi:hypothetical protein